MKKTQKGGNFKQSQCAQAHLGVRGEGTPVVSAKVLFDSRHKSANIHRRAYDSNVNKRAKIHLRVYHKEDFLDLEIILL